MLLGLLTACRSSTPSPTSAPTVADAVALLARHAAAVLHHDADAYLEDVSAAAPSAPFRAQERDDIANLAHVPLASWAYTDPQPVHDSGPVAAATKRYGTPVLVLHVSLRYALRDVDPLPTSHDLYLSFVRDAGGVRLAGDHDLAGDGSASWAGPWRYGPLAAARGTSSLVLGPATAPLADVAHAVDAAVPAVTAVWGTGWNRDVAVIVAGSAAEFSALVGSAELLQNVSAAAVTDGVDPVSHRPYGQRLVLAPAALDDLTGVGEGIVFRHELTHLATAAITDLTSPRWVVEGFAEYVANLGTGQPVGVAASELRTAVAAGDVPTQLPSEQAFRATGAGLARAYEQSWLACRLIAQRAGQDGLVRFYRTVTSAVLPAAQALTTALHDAVRLSLPAFTGQWRAYVRAQLS